jgi:beta-glucosidase
MTGNVNVSVKVTNTGARAGKETVILYVRDEAATVVPAGKRVRRFAKVHLEPGQTKTRSFSLNRNDLSFIGANNRPVVEPGDFTVLVGGLTDKFTLR